MSEKIPRIYIEACPIIDMAQEKSQGLSGNRLSAGVWVCQQALRAGRDRKAKILTSFLSIAECTRVNIDAATQPTSPPEDIKRFFEMLLLSGKSGMELIPITQAIAIRARNLRWVSDINLRGADTIHVASALQLQCNELWTRDGRIWNNRAKLAELGLSVVRPSETRFLPSEYQILSLFADENSEATS